MGSLFVFFLHTSSIKTLAQIDIETPVRVSHFYTRFCVVVAHRWSDRCAQMLCEHTCFAHSVNPSRFPTEKHVDRRCRTLCSPQFAAENVAAYARRYRICGIVRQTMILRRHNANTTMTRRYSIADRLCEDVRSLQYKLR